MLISKWRMGVGGGGVVRYYTIMSVVGRCSGMTTVLKSSAEFYRIKNYLSPNSITFPFRHHFCYSPLAAL